MTRSAAVPPTNQEAGTTTGWGIRLQVQMPDGVLSDRSIWVPVQRIVHYQSLHVTARYLVRLIQRQYGLPIQRILAESGDPVVLRAQLEDEQRRPLSDPALIPVESSCLLKSLTARTSWITFATILLRLLVLRTELAQQQPDIHAFWVETLSPETGSRVPSATVPHFRPVGLWYYVLRETASTTTSRLRDPYQERHLDKATVYRSLATLSLRVSADHRRKRLDRYRQYQPAPILSELPAPTPKEEQPYLESMLTGLAESLNGMLQLPIRNRNRLRVQRQVLLLDHAAGLVPGSIDTALSNHQPIVVAAPKPPGMEAVRFCVFDGRHIVHLTIAPEPSWNTQPESAPSLQFACHLMVLDLEHQQRYPSIRTRSVLCNVVRFVQPPPGGHLPERYHPGREQDSVNGLVPVMDHPLKMERVWHRYGRMFTQIGRPTLSSLTNLLYHGNFYNQPWRWLTMQNHSASFDTTNFAVFLHAWYQDDTDDRPAQDIEVVEMPLQSAPAATVLRMVLASIPQIQEKVVAALPARLKVQDAPEPLVLQSPEDALLLLLASRVVPTARLAWYQWLRRVLVRCRTLAEVVCCLLVAQAIPALVMDIWRASKTIEGDADTGVGNTLPLGKLARFVGGTSTNESLSWFQERTAREVITSLRNRIPSHPEWVHGLQLITHSGLHALEETVYSSGSDIEWFTVPDEDGGGGPDNIHADLNDDLFDPP